MKYKNRFNALGYILLIGAIGISGAAFVACRGSVKERLLKDLKDSLAANSSSTTSLTLVADLNVKIKETSGLALIGNNLITHNDKGRTNELMLISSENGNILQSFTVANVENNDWEDLARNEEFLFIGNMGNNEGERKNLAIHAVPVSSITKNTTELKSTGTISFYYPEQKEFDVSKKHNFDCEAILCRNNNLYLFTKNRLDDNTNLYMLPAKPGNYAATFIASFESGGRITGADISSDGKKVALIGYNKKSACFLWTFDGFTGDNFFTGKAKKYTLGQYAQVGQMEGITFKNDSTVYLSSEEIANVHARLYTFKLD